MSATSITPVAIRVRKKCNCYVSAGEAFAHNAGAENCRQKECSTRPLRDNAATVSRTAARSTAACRFRGPNKRAHELSFNLWRNRVHVNTLPGQEGPRVLNIVNAGRLDFDVAKPSFRELGDILVILKRSRDAPYPQQHIVAHLGEHFPVGDNVGDGRGRPPAFNTRNASRNTRSLSPTG